MSEFAEALDEALGARYALGPHSLGREPRGESTMVARIMRKFGGDRTKAADAAGIPRSTWRGWTTGKRKPSARNRAKLSAAYRSIFTAPARALVVKKRKYPSWVSIRAVVVVDPGPPDPVRTDGGRGGGRGGSRYVNGLGSGVTRAQVYNLTDPPAFRLFNADRLQGTTHMEDVVNVWLADGADAAALALTEAIAAEYDGEEFGFEGNHVEVTLHD